MPPSMRAICSPISRATSLAWVEIMKWAAPGTVTTEALAMDFGQKFVRAPHGRVTDPAPQNERRDIDVRKARRRQLEIEGARPIQDIHRRRVDRIAANAFRPGGERPGAAIEVDHRLDRPRFAGPESVEIGVGHLAEGTIVMVLSRVAQQLRQGRLDDHQAEHRHPLAERDGERGRAAEGMADEMHRRRRAPDDGLEDLGLAGNIGIPQGTAFGCPAIAEQACRHRAKAAAQLGEDGPPRRAGAAGARHEHDGRRAAVPGPVLGIVDVAAIVLDHGFTSS